MFYPGDPMEQKKRELIAKLSGARGGKGGGGSRVGRAPGFFGRGVSGGFGGAPGLGRAPGLQGNPAFGEGGPPGFGSFQGPPFQGGPQTMPIQGNQYMNMGPSSMVDVRALLQQYGLAPQPSPAGRWGMS